jgi:ribosomal protein L9
MVKQLLSEQAAESDRKLQKQAAESDRKLQKLEKQAAKHRELAAETNARLSALELTVAEQVRENGELVAQDRPVLRVAHCIPSQSLNRV